MATSSKKSVSNAWNALWETGNRFEIVPRLQHGGHDGDVWFRRLKPGSVPDTGPVVLLNAKPWGIVSVNLTGNILRGAFNIVPNGFDYSKDSGAITVEISFPDLTFAGDYTITRGQATSSGIKMALASFASRSAVASAPDPISQAKARQQQLAGTKNGQLMLSTYYQYNDHYADCFAKSPTWKLQWQKYVVPGQDKKKNSEYFANQTSAADQSGDPVNADPGYNVHAFSMQGFLYTAAYNLNYVEAANAANDFKGQTKPQSEKTVTADDVMTIVKTSPAPTKATDKSAALRSLAPRSQGIAMNAMQESDGVGEKTDDYSYVPEDRREAVRQHAEKIKKQIRQECEDVRNGIVNLEDTEAQITGRYVSRFASPTFRLTGTVRQSAGKAVVEFGSLDGDISDFKITLSAFPGKLHPVVQKALLRARFLHTMLGKRFVTALSQSPLKEDIGRMMTLALQRELDPEK